MKSKYLQLQIIVLSIKSCKKCCRGKDIVVVNQMQRILLARLNSYFPFIKNAIYTGFMTDLNIFFDLVLNLLRD